MLLFLRLLLFVGLWVESIYGVFAADKTQENSGLVLKWSNRLEDFLLPAGVTPPLFAEAERFSGKIDRNINVEEQGEIRRYRTVLKTDKLHYDQDGDIVDAYGHVRLIQDKFLLQGPEAHVSIGSGDAWMPFPQYQILNTMGWGRGDFVDVHSENQIDIRKGTYTTCPCNQTDPDWYLQMQKLHIDTDDNLADGQNSVLFFKGLPIFASPYLTFPINSERRSGFLPPTVGFSSKGGFELTTPYYFNIAPNYDWTLSPRFIMQRGLLLGNDYRYLTADYSGTINVDYINRDRLLGQNRYSLSWQHQANLPFNIKGYLNLNKVSDDNYPNDFANSGFQSGVQTTYAREGGLSWSNENWSVLLREQKFQTLPPSTAPYELVPQLDVKYQRFDWNGLDISVQNDYSRFRNPVSTQGERLFTNPIISYPLITSAAYFIPKIQLNATAYQLEALANQPAQNITRVLPIFSLDSGLNFERSIKLGNQNMTQTLEPRVFYVNIPYRDQSAIPLFDTALATFNISEIFSENNFVGNDRINNANRLTMGLTSAFIDDKTGIEEARFLIAQQYNFVTQRVTLDASQKPNSTKLSNILVGASTNLGHSVHLDTAAEYDGQNGQIARSDFGMSWKPDERKVFNIFYRYLRPSTALLLTEPSFNQIEVSAQWPITTRLYGIGRFNYAIDQRQTVDTLLGFEYDADCWIFKVGMQRFSSSTGQMTSRVLAQLELKGFSKLGTGVTQAFRRSVPGYMSSPSAPVLSRFNNYE